MSVELERGLRTIELLSSAPGGMSFTEVCTKLDSPKGATHRLLQNLVQLDFIRFDESESRYSLTLKSVSSALKYLSVVPIVEFARPWLKQLAAASGELARLTLIENNTLTRVARAQGSVAGLKYDPDHGGTVRLSCAASGYVWLATLEESVAIDLLEQDGFARHDEFGLEAPRDLDAALKILQKARTDGYCYLTSTYETGIATIAYPILDSGHSAQGVLTVAGPEFRFAELHALRLLPLLREAASELGNLEGLHE